MNKIIITNLNYKDSQSLIIETNWSWKNFKSIILESSDGVLMSKVVDKCSPFCICGYLVPPRTCIDVLQNDDKHLDIVFNRKGDGTVRQCFQLL